ncbi:MAG TPA: DUF1638 domain-containing protein [Methanomassiliicoccales archaeon]|nr:DUF1638 domain-containing protein [Euryarchaeota archaeon]HOE52143.1 DUF1638 domain-containing protein [Methanomassiliicoccales archaeon]
MDEGNGRARLAIIACEILKPELEKLTEGWDDVVHKEYLEFALHINPEDLRAKVLDKVNALQGKADAVFLGYATCQSLSGITAHLKVPTVMLDGDDCIAAVLGPVEYARQKSLCGGTWFNTPGWALRGIDGAIKELHLDSMVDQGYEPKYFLDMLFENYERCLYVDTDVGDGERYERLSRKFAEELGLRHENRPCGTANLAKFLVRAREMARANASKAQ